LNKPIRTLIVDDEPAIRRDLQRLLSRHPEFVEVGACGSVAEAKVLIPATRPSLILLDIHLSDGTSFELLEQIKPISFKIIFITAHNDGAMKAIKVGALDYLLKPVDETEFADAINRVLETATESGQKWQSQEQLSLTQDSFWAQTAAAPKRIALRNNQFVEIIDIENIIYCMSDHGYTNFYLTDGRKILASRTLKQFEDLLPESMFLRPHQSYLVQKRFVDRYHRDGVLILNNKAEIPVSTRRRDDIIASLTE